MPAAVKPILFAIWLLSVCFVSCNRDGVIEVETHPAPTIEFDNPTGVYTVKAGRELTISPVYTHAEGARFTWSIDGTIVGEERSLLFREEHVGTVYVLLTVATQYGTASEELRVEVVALEVPTVSIPGAEKGFTILASSDLELRPSVAETTLPSRWLWTVDGREVSTDLDYTFRSADPGLFTLCFNAANEDGEDSVSFTVRVVGIEEMPFGWTFEQTEYHVSTGRTIRLVPLDIVNAYDAVYTWTIDGRQVQEGPDPAYCFTAAAEGDREATVTMRNSFFEVSQRLTIRVCPPEGRYYRPRTAASSPDWTRVYAFLPAPGQFVNENYAAATPEEACAYAEQRMLQRSYVSLGGFGGYIVVGFDHSIDASGGYDLAILGNSFEGSSEPGIVWVMQDENGDGEPNDTWYELKGSETGRPETLQDYAVTYYRPSGAGMEVRWTDNRGGSGSIDYLKQFHDQGFYYPAWVASDSYTLRGTCLEARNYDRSGNGTYWVNASYDWGYADNFSPIDRLDQGDNASAAANANHFRITDAITFDGRPAGLKYIDFVKVQTGVNAKSGWLGELSTEVFGFYDCGMKRE